MRAAQRAAAAVVAVMAHLEEATVSWEAMAGTGEMAALVGYVTLVAAARCRR